MKENLKEQIQLEAKRQMITWGYSKTTIRSVATACKIGVGTMYTYFKSKDELISSFMLDDWRKCIAEMEGVSCTDPKVFLGKVQETLLKFIHKYETLFRDNDAIRAFAEVFSERHMQLRSRLAKVIMPICSKIEESDKELFAEHIAESIIRWSMEGKDFDRQYKIIEKLI
ncbi:MAG: TetR/AcrR family transcriptional regulator [Butyrivibrio sp.]|nr:TetR/AcrR family transcriptional regulator [Butyrivibrio sp.]